MPRRVELLYRLQRIDTRLTLKRRRYKQVEANLGESEALQQARAKLASAQAELTHWKAALLDRELDVAAVTEKQRENEHLLYSGQVRDPRELTDLQKESAYLKRRKESLEEKQLEALMMVEEVTTKVAIAYEEHTVVESAWRAENSELTQEYDALKRELARLLAKRKAFARRISARDMEEYNAIRKLKRGIAVTAVRNDICQTCHVQVPQRAIDMARGTDGFMYCSGCDRILYVPEE
jgi:predicted  nucleic acid-binding Zn-ribbon protein